MLANCAFVIAIALGSANSAIAQAESVQLHELTLEIQRDLLKAIPNRSVVARLHAAEGGVSLLRVPRTEMESRLKWGEYLSPNEVRQLLYVRKHSLEGVAGVGIEAVERMAPEEQEALEQKVIRRKMEADKVYGPDDRSIVGPLGTVTRAEPPRVGRVTPQPNVVAHVAQATVLLIPAESLEPTSGGKEYRISGVKSLTALDNSPICAGFAWSKLPVLPGRCATGFLAGPRRLVTARHVVEGDNRVAFPAFMAGVFDYTQQDVRMEGTSVFIRADRVVRFEAQERSDPNSLNDWAVLTIKTDVPGFEGAQRTPLTLREHRPEIGSAVFTMGFPNAMVMMLSDDGYVAPKDPSVPISNPHCFPATLDVFGGNSGGPVVNLDGTVCGVVCASADGCWAKYDPGTYGRLGFVNSIHCLAPMQVMSAGVGGETCLPSMLFRNATLNP